MTILYIYIYISPSIIGGRKEIKRHEKQHDHYNKKYHLQCICKKFNSGKVNNKQIRNNNPGLVVAEVTQPSLGVGYELGRAADMKEKKVLCLFRPSSGRALSAMIRGAADGRRLQVVDYSEDQLEAVLDRFFSSLQSV
uniref:Uncharacterized protein n=1 Tax=Poecilia reticulata TaxID=8081 RepID=A0A3P9PES6_POERE